MTHVEEKAAFYPLLRGIIRLHGENVCEFLQGLITNDILLLPARQAIYTCLLTPQGKYLFDFFAFKADSNDVWLDVEAGPQLEQLIKLLKLYRLRRAITIEDLTATHQVQWSLMAPDTSTPLYFADPRHPEMGYRALVSLPAKLSMENAPDQSPYIEQRLSLSIPESSYDLAPNKAIALEYNLDHLHAFHWQKGCYVGQELMARVKHRGLIRKRVFVIHASLPLERDMPLRVEGLDTAKEAGLVVSSYGTKGFALIRLEALQRARTAQKAFLIGETQVDVMIPAWLPLDALQPPEMA